MQEHISIDLLKPGMFVEGVTKQKGTLKVRSQGWVKSAAVVKQLKKAGILEVCIDPSKTLSDKEKKPATQPSMPTSDTTPFRRKAKPMSAEMDTANQLYEQAKNLQKRAFKDIQLGNKLDKAEFEQVAGGLIDSVFRNQDALCCISQIRDKDSYLLEHSVNVAVLMTIFAKHMKLEDDIIQQLTTGALLHDLGKIKIDDAILHKPGRLTGAEFEEIKSHASHSKAILLEAGLDGIAVDIAAYHHERLDGTGYPEGLSGEQLSTYVRMISIVDVYDALTAKRVYKDGMNAIQAFKILKEGCPHHFDEDLVNAFIKCIGLHPVGSLVKLKSQKLGVVSKSNLDNPLKPCVKVFYNAAHAHYIEVKDIDLAKYDNDALETGVKPEDFNLDLMRFFKQSLLP